MITREHHFVRTAWIPRLVRSEKCCEWRFGSKPTAKAELGNPPTSTRPSGSLTIPRPRLKPVSRSGAPDSRLLLKPRTHPAGTATMTCRAVDPTSLSPTATTSSSSPSRPATNGHPAPPSG